MNKETEVTTGLERSTSPYSVATDSASIGRTAIMQPYYFPYLGYYQLFHAASTFVMLDDADFIKKGWVNRNRILLQGKPHTFTLPVRSLSQNVSILDTEVAIDHGWNRKFLHTLTHAYRKAPMFDDVFPLLSDIINLKVERMAHIAEISVTSLLGYLGITPHVLRSSAMDLDPQLHGQDRIIAICKATNTTCYVNPQGGRMLYTPDLFKKQGMDLRFLHMQELEYDQGQNSAFQSGLSMIDILMWNSKAKILEMLTRYSLEE